MSPKTQSRHVSSIFKVALLLGWSPVLHIGMPDSERQIAFCKARYKPQDVSCESALPWACASGMSYFLWAREQQVANFGTEFSMSSFDYGTRAWSNKVLPYLAMFPSLPASLWATAGNQAVPRNQIPFPLAVLHFLSIISSCVSCQFLTWTGSNSELQYLSPRVQKVSWDLFCILGCGLCQHCVGCH